MSNPISPKTEREFALRFIESLEADINSSKHGLETNVQALMPAIRFLKERALCPELSVERIVRGALNMAIYFENLNYDILNANLIGNEKLELYTRHSKRWFADYGKARGKIWEEAIPVITRASKGPLFMMTSCVPNTLALYFDYVALIDEEFKVNQLPDADLKYAFKESPPKALFMFEAVYQAVNVSYLDECEYFNTLIKGLRDKTEDLKTSNPDKVKAIIAAENLVNSLSGLVHYYENHELCGHSIQSARSSFIEYVTKAINKAKPLLEAELGWGDYLVNLLKTIGNGFIKTTNYVVRSDFTLFAPAKALMIPEVESFEKSFNDNLNWS